MLKNHDKMIELWNEHKTIFEVHKLSRSIDKDHAAVMRKLSYISLRFILSIELSL